MPTSMKDKQLQANRNADAMRLAWSSIRDQIEKAALGGGRQRIEKEHAKGKLTARERLQRLFDTGSRPDRNRGIGWRRHV